MYDSNLPAGLPPDFNNESDPVIKQCPGCKGLGVDSDDGIITITCGVCLGSGEIEMTPEEIYNILEEKRENKHSNDL